MGRAFLCMYIRIIFQEAMSNFKYVIRPTFSHFPALRIIKKKIKKNTTDKRWEKIRKTYITILFSTGSRIVVIKSTVSSQVFFFFVSPANRGKGKKGLSSFCIKSFISIISKMIGRGGGRGNAFSLPKKK